MRDSIHRFGWIVAIGLIAAVSHVGAADRIPITTTSDEARQLYLQGRDLNEKIRVTDSQTYFQQAIAKDPDFALAHLAVAQNAADVNEFWNSLSRAASLVPKVSEGERRMILGFDAGARGNPEVQKQHYTELVSLFPDDERALTLLGIYYSGAQEYPLAIEYLERATKLNPDFATAYNQLGYLYWYTMQYPKAEQAFRKYTELIPNEPNPYDSYAEFLMKMGRFDESIKAYEKALTINPNFISSHAGICNDQVFLGNGEAARATCDRLSNSARNVGEKRQAFFWKATSYLHEGRVPDAIASVRQMSTLSEKSQDMATMAADLDLIGNILLETGKPDDALTSYRQAMEMTARAAIPDEAKEAARRFEVYQEARVALAKGDIAGAKAKTDQFRKLVAVKQIPFEVRQSHELAGRVALEEKNYEASLAELKMASQLDPRVLYLEARAYEGAGDKQNAGRCCDLAANFNGLDMNYAFVRKPAMEMLARVRPAH